MDVNIENTDFVTVLRVLFNRLGCQGRKSGGEGGTGSLRLANYDM